MTARRRLHHEPRWWHRLASRRALAALELAAGVVLGGMALAGAAVLRRMTRDHERLSSVLASIAEGVVITDPAGRIVLVNSAMEGLAGLAEAEVLGRGYTEIYPLLDSHERPIPSDRHILARALQSGRPVVSHGYELALMSRERRIPVTVTAAPVYDRHAALLGGVALFRDASQEEEVDRLKSSLVSTVSHELRTPLTMIQGFSELLMTRDLGEARSREALKQINASSERLSRLIDDLLSVSRIESGRLVTRISPVDLPQVVKEVIPAFERRGGPELRTDLDQELPLLLADRDMLVQILTNLVSNAVKYSAPATPVSITAHANESYIVVAVEDQGIGMTEEEALRVFDKFARVDRPEVRRAGGTGLGLYITKSLVEMQGGQIWVRSEPGRGSSFFFCLPSAPAAPSRDEHPSDAKKGAS